MKSTTLDIEQELIDLRGKCLRMRQELDTLRKAHQLTVQALEDQRKIADASVMNVGQLAIEKERLGQRVMMLELENERLKADIEELREKA